MLLVEEKNKFKLTGIFLRPIIKFLQNIQVRVMFYQKGRPFVVGDIFSTAEEKAFFSGVANIVFTGRR